MIALEVGQRWPYPTSEGMTALIDPGETHAQVMLVCGLADPLRGEIDALARQPIRVGVLASPPLAWVVLLSKGLSLDAPYALGLHTLERIDRIVTCLAGARAWSPETRGLLTVATIDTDAGITRGLRAISLSRAWWVALAEAIGNPPRIGPAERDAAIARDLARWTDTKSMIPACAAVEVGGAV